MSVLVLAGTGEARQLLARATGLPIVASLAGVTRRPKPLGVPTRIGGFGGRDGFVQYVRRHGFQGVLDMTHPFAANMPLRTAALCAELSLPYLRYLRPEWEPEDGDRWTPLQTLEQAAAYLPSTATVFFATGAQTPPPKALYDRTLWLRRVDDAPPANWPNGGYVIGLPANDPLDEVKMFQKYNITHVVCKNSGGAQGRAKLGAARQMGLPVLMLRRPPAPNAPTTQSVKDAGNWMRRHAL